jgi:protoporphyrinogen oxidase
LDSAPKSALEPLKESVGILEINSSMQQRVAIIIGAGPAGLTAAYELLKRTDVKPIVLERSEYMGGIARTVEYKGNRIDIGGHRFFSKSDRVMNWWLQFLPLQASRGAQTTISHQQSTRAVEVQETRDPDAVDLVMLVRHRRSRIYFLRRLFDYPISLSKDTIQKLGLARTFRIGVSYLRAVLFPIADEQNLEQFFINRFGKELYRTFFQDYTEKVWGIPCDKISAEWGAQRVKGLSITKAVVHHLRKMFGKKQDLAQKESETSLIEQFLYPKLGPGQLWEEVARQVKEMGGEILTSYLVNRIEHKDGRVTAVEARNASTGDLRKFEGDYFFSTMPVKDLLQAMDPSPPAAVRRVGDHLVYRDFLTVGLLCEQLKVRDDHAQAGALIKDNWIYIQEPDVKLGRLQIFNNWSPYMVSDKSKIWVGLEYFCFEGDELWSMPDEELVRLGTQELAKIDIIDQTQVLDGTVLRMDKTYPAYFGSYDRFPEIRKYVDGVENLFLVGRNGMHKYNNQDHSMLTSMVAVDNIAKGSTNKENVWAVNTEQEYHEEK